MQEVFNWFKNITAYGRKAEEATGARVTKQIVRSLVGCGIKKRKKAKMRKIFAYLALFRARLTPILNERWKAAKAADNLPDNQQLAFRNAELDKMILDEPQDVLNQIEEFRDVELAKAVDEPDEEDEMGESIMPIDPTLPAEEKERLMVARARQMYENISLLIYNKLTQILGTGQLIVPPQSSTSSHRPFVIERG